MLSEEVKRYRELSGDNNPHTPISRIGGYLDGYEKALEQEPCEDAISRRDMALNIVSFYNKATGKKKTLDFLCKCVEGLPSVQPKPKTGHWIATGAYYTGAYGSIDYVECSCCHEDSLEEGNYCPNCGAKMEEGD